MQESTNGCIRQQNEFKNYRCQMGLIITRDVPSCIRCGGTGSIIQEGVIDPDGMIPGDWRYRLCDNPGCALVWLDPAPLPEELWKAYTHYHTHTQHRPDKVPRQATSLFNRLCRMVLWPVWLSNGLRKEARNMRLMGLDRRPPGTLLDVGCGGGRFLKRMQRRGWQVVGIDFDEQATRRVREKFGIETYTGDLVKAQFPEASYDAITMSHAIEHLLDPAATLRECMRILKPGGQLTIVTPNFESRACTLFGPSWRGWEPPRHLHLFSLGSLKQMLEDAGFEILEARSSAAASAIVYRVSWNLLHPDRAASLWPQLKLIPWSYLQELQDYRMQHANERVAQNLLAVATRPFT